MVSARRSRIVRIMNLCLIVIGNANLVYTIIRKRHVFHALASLPTDCGTINRSLSRRGRKQLGRQPSVESVKDAPSMEGSHPALPAQPGTHTCSLAIMPGTFHTLNTSIFYINNDNLIGQGLKKLLSKKRLILHCNNSVN